MICKTCGELLPGCRGDKKYCFLLVQAKKPLGERWHKKRRASQMEMMYLIIAMECYLLCGKVRNLVRTWKNHLQLENRMRNDGYLQVRFMNKEYIWIRGELYGNV